MYMGVDILLTLFYVLSVFSNLLASTPLILNIDLRTKDRQHERQMSFFSKFFKRKKKLKLVNNQQYQSFVNILDTETAFTPTTMQGSISIQNSPRRRGSGAGFFSQAPSEQKGESQGGEGPIDAMSQSFVGG